MPPGSIEKREPGPDATDWTLIWVGALLFTFVLAHHLLGDDIFRFQDLDGLLSRGLIPAKKFSMIGPLLGAPLWLLGRICMSSEWWWTRFGLMLGLAPLLVIAWTFQLPEDARLLRRFAAILLTASMLPHALIGNGAELLTTVTALVGFLALARGHNLFGWCAILIGAANAPATVPATILVALAHAFRSKRFRYAFMPLFAVGAITVENWLRYGSALRTGYAVDLIDIGQGGVLPYSGLPGFSYPFGFGLLSIFFSFGKGLIFFAPGILLAPLAWSKAKGPSTKDFMLYSLIFLAGLVLVYAKWWCWYGGWAWGPRFFLFAAIPASMAIALCLDKSVSTLAAAFVAGLLTLSCWVALSSVIYSYDGMQVCTANNNALELLCWYTPEFSVLWRPLMSGKIFTAGKIVWIVYFGIGWLALTTTPRATLLAYFSANASSWEQKLNRIWKEMRW